ncbi:MAG: hypothetical protein IE928_10325 [Gammaproteobacteria bacterium]|nr:hypothetical protein [Gammaproteobacteria bacterium]
MEDGKKKKSWFWWVAFAVVMAGGAALHIPGGLITPLANSAADVASESVGFDD